MTYHTRKDEKNTEHKLLIKNKIKNNVISLISYYIFVHKTKYTLQVLKYNLNNLQ